MLNELYASLIVCKKIC